MLGNEERNTAVSDTLLVFRHHVVTHDLHITTVGLLEEFSYDMRFGVEGDAMVNLRMLFEELLQDNDDLLAIVEDLNIYWVDDLDYALICACQSLRDIARRHRWDLPPLYRSDMLAAEGKSVDSDKAFAEKLLEGAYDGFDSYEQRISEATSGWDKDRICNADRVLIILGLAEVEHIPAVPARVSVNEWVEITKYFSTPRSTAFVNGLLDRLVPQLIAEKGLPKQL